MANLCTSEYALGDDFYPCQLLTGHDGPHRYEDDSEPETWEQTTGLVLTWRDNPTYRKPEPSTDPVFRLAPDLIPMPSMRGLLPRLQPLGNRVSWRPITSVGSFYRREGD